MTATTAVHPFRHEHLVAPDQGTRQRPQPPMATCYYLVDTVDELPTVNVTRTVLSKLVGRLDDDQFNKSVRCWCSRFDALFHILGGFFFFCCLSLLIESKSKTRLVVSIAGAVTGLPVVGFVISSLSWDMLRLSVWTYEFWFLSLINVFDSTMWNVLLRGERQMALIVSAMAYHLPLMLDANVYSRRLVVRMLVLGSPGLFVGLMLVALRIAPDVASSDAVIAGMRIDMIDLLLNGNVIIAYFTAVKLYHSRRLLAPKSTFAMVPCEMYFPLCWLVPATPDGRLVDRARQLHLTPSTLPADTLKNQQLQLHQRQDLRVLDSSYTLIPCLNTAHFTWFSPRIISTMGLMGIVCFFVSASWRLCTLHMEMASSRFTDSKVLFDCFGLAVTILFVAIHAAHYQCVLLRRLLNELDAWFVSIQVTAVAVAACDIMNWDHRAMFIFTAWIWCHWTIFLDALTPVVRHRLGHSRLFALFVNILLFIFPILMAYWIYFANVHGLSNRVILSVRVYEVNMRLEMRSFLASKLFTLWAWMGRFLWRELMRPPTAFKMIKYRVQYAVPSDIHG